MSLKEKYEFTFIKENNNTLDFKLLNGNTYAKIMVLEEDIIRILFTDGEKVKLDKTWSVAPGQADVPWEGRDRFDLSVFSLPDYDSRQVNDEFIVETSLLKLQVKLDGFKISWFYREDSEWMNFANDRQTQAYNFDGSLGQGIVHYLKRNLHEQYFGLGEKAGSVDKHGKRYRMETIDAMGYDAEYTDPYINIYHFILHGTRILNFHLGFFTTIWPTLFLN